jgi:hypothetical protein
MVTGRQLAPVHYRMVKSTAMAIAGCSHEAFNNQALHVSLVGASRAYVTTISTWCAAAAAVEMLCSYADVTHLLDTSYQFVMRWAPLHASQVKVSTALF